MFVEDGWRDAFEAGDIRMYEALAAPTVSPTYLERRAVHPQGLRRPEAPTDNPPGQDNVEAQEIRFDQRYLMGLDVPKLPRRSASMTSRRTVRRHDRWPPPETKFERDTSAPGHDRAARPARLDGSYFTNPAAGFSMTLDEQGTVAASP